MCRNIKPLYNFKPPATKEDVHNAALQFVRKISGYHGPSQVNQVAFNTAVEQIAQASTKLIGALKTKAPQRSRAEEESAAKQRAITMFGHR